MNLNDYSKLTEGRYIPHGDISYTYALNRIENNKRHIIYTGFIMTYDEYEEAVTGTIAHSMEDWISLETDPLEHIEKNKWKQTIASEIVRQIDNPNFAQYNFSFLNSVHNSAVKTRA